MKATRNYRVEDKRTIYSGVSVEADNEHEAALRAMELMMGCPLDEVDEDVTAGLLADLDIVELKEEE